MKNGLSRFTFYLDQLEILVLDAAKQKNPGLWLYQNNVRTPLFMLEGLARLYSSLHNKKRFARIDMHFKLVEDALGAIDYYDAFAREFAKDKKISAAVTKAVEAKAVEKTKALNKLLVKKNWLGKDANRIARIRAIYPRLKIFLNSSGRAPAPGAPPKSRCLRPLSLFEGVDVANSTQANHVGEAFAASLRWRAPAPPRSCSTISAICPMPVGPMG